MKTIRYILVAILCVVLFTACDSREDWWVENDEKPTYSFDSDVVDTSKYEDMFGRKYYDLELLCGNEKRVRLNNLSQSYDRDFTMKAYGRLVNPDCYFIDIDNVNEEWDNVFNKEFMDVYFDNSTHEIVIRNKVITEELQRSTYEIEKSRIEKDGLDYFRYPKWETNVLFKLTNCVGVEVEVCLRLIVYANMCPLVDIKVENIGGKERMITALASDPEKLGIKAYEYCIDGDVEDNMSAYEYVNYFWSDSPEYEMSKPNRNKYGDHSQEMVYITATKLSSIKHAFQTSGKHVVWVRAQDKLGYWSSWKSKEIFIE
ncbi:MAG: hypothetical protein MJZ14_02585 [Paludibacteraceae bacterium]|nr:hypothetical protein [Paludibacteraceae bacterium]